MELSEKRVYVAYVYVYIMCVHGGHSLEKGRNRTEIGLGNEMGRASQFFHVGIDVLYPIKASECHQAIKLITLSTTAKTQLG